MDAFKTILKIESTPTGKGVFAKAPFVKGTVVFEFTGTIFTKATLPANEPYLQVGPDAFMGPSGDLDDFIRHHCDPNCGFRIVGNRALLFALYDIKAGMELTFDYSTTSTEAWIMNCDCGYSCRKTIGGFQSLTAEQQTKYTNLNAVPSYVLKA